MKSMTRGDFTWLRLARQKAASSALRRAHQPQFAVIDIARNGAARCHDRIVADFHRRHQRGVRPDEGASADPRLIFEEAIIVARDRASTDVRARPDLRVT